jgi:putative ABC transport system substrate-binding protein
MKSIILILFSALIVSGCSVKKSDTPLICFADAFEDNTLARAKQGFFDALKDSGYSEEKKTIKVAYRNAQGNIPTLTQIINYFISQKPVLIATCPTLTSITAVQNTKDIPVFMMVAGTPSLMKLLDSSGKEPANLFGVGEQLDYIDTSFLLIPKIIKPKADKLVVGMIFNQSEPQSVEAMNRIRALAQSSGMTLMALPVNNSADVQLVTASLLSKNPDVFFANPDNTVFASFETIAKSCSDQKVPVMTSEAGLVERGALAAYGADIYQWGYQSGQQAAHFLKTGTTKGMHWELVKSRKKVFNKKVAADLGITMPELFEPIP